MSNTKFNARHGLSVGSTPVDIIDSSGAILVNSASATKLATPRTISISGDITYTSPSFDGSSSVSAAATLAASGVTAGSYGSTSAIPVITVDAKGRVTAASTASVTVPTLTSQLTNDSGFATQTYVNSAVSNLVAAAPTTLDTLNELAAALGNDASFAATTATSLGLKAVKTTTISAGTGLTGGGDLSANRTLSLATSGVTAGTYNNVTVDVYGRATSGSTVAYLTSYTETDTLASVTGRGATTSTMVTVSGGGDNTNTYSSVRFAGYNQGGGVGYHGVFELQNTYASATNAKKFFRLDSSGTLQVINSAYTNNLFNLTDAGALTIPGAFGASNISGSHSGTNTGDETTATIKTKLGITTLSGSNTGDQTITLTGDVTGSGTSSFATTLAASGVTAGSGYNTFTVDAKGRVTAASTTSYLTSYSETSTLANVTARGATSSTAITLSALLQLSNQAAINTTTPGTGNYGLHFTGQTTADYATGITWNGGTGTTGAQAGIYVQGSGNYGTKMYIATTDSYAAGSKTAISIDHTGLVNFIRQRPQYAGNMILDVGNIASYAVTSISATTPIVASASTGAVALSHATSGVTAGTYNNVTVNGFGHVTGGSNTSYLTSYTETDTLASVTGRGNVASAGNLGMTAGEGYGFTFWGAGDAYKLSMGSSVGTYQYGPVTDYSIKTQMDGTAGRGFTWGVVGQKPVAGLNSINGNMQIAGNFIAVGSSTWGAGSTSMNSGNPRSLAIGYSGGNYGGAGYGIAYTTTSGNETYAIADVVSKWTAYDGLQVSAAAAGTVGTTVSWTTVLDARRSNTSMLFNGKTVLDSSNYSSYALPLNGGAMTGTLSITKAGVGVGAASAINLTGDITSSRAANQGVIYLGTNGTSYLYADGSGNYILGTGSTTLSINGNTALHAGNYNSYSPTLTGGGASGTWGISVTGSSASTTYVSSPDGDRLSSTKLPTTNARTVRYDFVSAAQGNGAGNYAGLMTYAPWDGTSASTGDSSYQLSFGNDSGVNASGMPRLSLRNGINSTWNSWYILLHAGNYNSYSPTLTGGNASGTWNITSAAVSGFTLTSSSNGVNPDNVTQNQLGYNTSVSLFGQTDGGLYSSAYSSAWIHQIYGDFRTGQIAVRGKNSGTWQSWRGVLDSSNYSNYALPLSGGYVSGIYGRAAHSSGFLCGSYNNVGSNDAKTNPIYTIGSAYAPSDTAIGNMYGIGYSHANFFGTAAGTDWGLYVVAAGSYSALITGAGAWFKANVTAYSDETLKKNWRDLPIDFVDQLANVKHGIYDRTDMELTQVGVSAQSLKPVLEHAVTEDDSGKLSVAYGNAALVSAVELAKEVVDLRARVAQLEKLISAFIKD